MIGETILKRYKIEAELGKGGMGTVYRAYDSLLDRAVAIKFLNAAGVDISGRARLLQEARAAAKLNHPNVVSVFDAGEIDGDPFIVMEFVEGNTLRKQPTSDLKETLATIRDICKALDHAHTNGIIHRDLKLENVVISNTQTVKLMDFGLARISGQDHLTEEGTIIGTFAYLAPELIQGVQASPRSDMYALGIVFYELLTGSAPFRGTITEILSQHLQARVKPPSALNPNVPAWVDRLVLELLSKRPEERPASAKEVLLVLEKQSDALDSTFQYRVTTTIRNNLPVQLSTFIGRKTEIQQVSDAIKASRLVTLTGVGGTGKTRLALQAASRSLDEFSDGVWFVELAPVTNPNLIPQSVASTLQLQEVAGRQAFDAVIEFFRTRNTLLLLDNCEHLIQACAEFSSNLLQECESVVILTTSREPLGIMGEVILSVPSLSCPKTDTSLPPEELIQFESIELFVERARAVQPNFSLNTTNADSVAQICTRLDGIPLALELAAVRVRGMSVDQIASRLDNRFRLLTGGSRTAMQRQQTLGAMVDWSYNLLTDKERLLFQNLSVFIGSFSLEAVEQICSMENVDALEVLDLLQRLVDKSMVITEERYGETYYRLLETIRQYGRNRLLVSEEAEFQASRHAGYFMKLAKQARIELRGPNQILWTHRFIMMQDNLRAALEWVTETGKVNDALRFVCDLYEFWLRHADFEEAARWLRRIAALPQAHQHLELHLESRNNISWTLWLQGESDEAREMAEQNLVLARSQTNRSNTAEALINLGMMVTFQEDFAKGQSYIEEARDICQEVQDEWVLARALMDLAVVHSMQSHYLTAHSYYSDALALYKHIGDINFQCLVLRLIGNLEVSQNNLKESIKNYCESLLIARAVKSNLQICHNIWGLANVAIRMKNYSRAVRLFMASKRLLEGVAVWNDGYALDLERAIQPARSTLDSATYSTVVEQGYTMTMEQAIEYALEARYSELSCLD